MIDREGRTHLHGDTGRTVRIASVSKLFTAWAATIAVEEGATALDEPVGQEGCTVRHLLAHAGGYSFDGVNPITSPARKRIYSNTGIEILADHVGRVTGIDFPDYLHEAVCEPLGLTSTTCRVPLRRTWSATSTTAFGSLLNCVGPRCCRAKRSAR